MSSSVAVAQKPTQSQSVRRDLPSAKPKAARLCLDLPEGETQGNRSATLALIDEARIRAGLKQEAFAAFAGVTPGTFSQGLNERNHKSFNAAWLDRAPIEFWVSFHKLIGLKFNLTTETRRDLILKRTEQLMEDIKELLR